jgi:hypothetical protein
MKAHPKTYRLFSDIWLGSMPPIQSYVLSVQAVGFGAVRGRQTAARPSHRFVQSLNRVWH